MRGEVLREVLPFADGFGMEMGMTVDAVRAGYSASRRSSFRSSIAPATGRSAASSTAARQLRDFRRAARARDR